MTERIVDLEPEVLRDARERAAELIRCGFLEQEEVAELLVDSFDDQGLDAAAADALVGPLWEARLAEQSAWPEQTDVDRLGRAFDLLECQGLVAAMDFTCCSTCGFAEIGAEADENTRGFVFFHQQDTERAAAGQGLLLRYGAFGAAGAAGAAEAAEAERAAEAVGREVVAALAGAGLGAEWDGSARSAIRVTPLEWLNRLPE